MQKKLIAVAVAGALSAPALALAQASTVQVYGAAILEYGYANQGNGKPNTDLIQAPAGAALGFKGEEALGDGLSAWFQCENTMDVRGDSAAGFCTRNSALGMKGGFGSVYLGKWDTPFKKVDLRGYVGSEVTGLTGAANILTGFSTGSTAGAANSRTLWERRQHDMISYDTPKMSGFQGLFGYSAANATATTNASTSAKPRIYSLAALYDNGPVALGLGYEKHLEFGSVGGSQNDYAWVLAGSYAFSSNVKVGGSYNKQNYDLGAGLSSEKKSWQLGVDWKISGPHGLRAFYVNTDDISGNGGLIASGSTAISAVPAAGPNTGARLWAINYVHTFSKRTQALFGYVRLENDANANYTLGGLVTTGLTAAQQNGKSQDAWALRVKHSF